MRPRCGIFLFFGVVTALVCSIALGQVLDERTNRVLGHVDSSTPSELRLRRGRRHFEVNPKPSNSQFNHYQFNRRSEDFIRGPSGPILKDLSAMSEGNSLERRSAYTVVRGNLKEVPMVGLLPPEILDKTSSLKENSPITRSKARRMVYGWINPGYDGVELTMIGRRPIKGKEMTKTLNRQPMVNNPSILTEFSAISQVRRNNLHRQVE